MNRQFQECYLNRLSDTSQIFPFFWQHGESHEVLKAEMDAIRADGCTEFCVESRTHEQFCEEKWWEDFGFMLDYAREHGMRVWLLDDKRFPTGYANGYMEQHPELRKVLLTLDYRDYTGPTEQSRIVALPLNKELGETFVSVTIWKQSEDFRSVVGEPIDLTDRIDSDGLLTLSLPAGNWRIYYCKRTLDVGHRKSPWIDMLNPASAHAQIDAVYQPHYEHFKDYFGNVFRGFFSDEPSFANAESSYLDTVGTEGLRMNWRDDLPELIAKEIGKTPEQVRLWLPALWHTLPAFGPAVRAGYMDVVTKLYAKNFTEMLADWCKERKVEYIGHIIEDNNTHQRLGFGAGHYFRSLAAQSMSGIDIVLNQFVPFNSAYRHTGPVCGKYLDPVFFNYLLPKLGASLAHITPHMDNHAMAEVFGAFGWAEGVGYMKFIADYFLASGINRFVPHAYSPRYPDRDCPPHFHAAGLNNQEEAFGKLMRYMQKVARLTEGGVHRADVALFYNCQGEWTGGKNDPIQYTAKRLTQAQIDFDVLPEDALYTAHVKNGKLTVHRETYGALLVPYAEILPNKILKTLARLQSEGLPVLYLDQAPVRAADGKPAQRYLTAPEIVPSEKLVTTLRARQLFRVYAPNAKFLRSYRVDNGEETTVLLFNEGDTAIDTFVRFKGLSNPLFYDVWNNVIGTPETKNNRVRLRLAPGQALVLLAGSAKEAIPWNYDETPTKPLSAAFKITAYDAGSDQGRIISADGLPTFNRPDFEPNFCGKIVYTAQVSLSGRETVLDLGRVGELAEVKLNGRSCGLCVAAPYRFRIGKAVKAGENELEITVYNTPAYREKDVDPYATYLPLSASGLHGPIEVGE